MAIAKIHYNVFKDSELFEVFYNFFTKVTLIERNIYKQTITFRVEGDKIPTDDSCIVLELYKFEGVRPFVIGVEIYAHDNRRRK